MKPDRLYGTAFLVVSVGSAHRALQGGFWLLLVWPCLSFFLVSLAYFFGAVCVFGKRENGTRARVPGVLLLPYLLLTWIVWELQTRIAREPPWHAVDDSLIVSRRLRPRELPQNVAALIDLTSEFVDPASIRSLPGYRCIPILDANALTPERLAECVRGLPRPAEGRIIVHCANGHGRTGLCAAAWMICHGTAKTPAEAIERLQSKRPGIHLRPCQQESLEAASRILASTIEPGPRPERRIGHS